MLRYHLLLFQIYSMDQWTSVKERKFDDICENAVNGMDKLDNLWQFCQEARIQKPVFHFIGTLLFFFSLAALGNRINNFFLAYILTNAFFMLPGLHKRGILQQYGASILLKINEVVKGKDYLKKAEWTCTNIVPLLFPPLPFFLTKDCTPFNILSSDFFIVRRLLTKEKIVSLLAFV